MRNKHGVRITTAERKYLNSLKASIRQSVNRLDIELEAFRKPSYLAKKTDNYLPVVKKTTVHTFKTREDFLKEVEKLTTLKSDLAIRKTRKPKEYEDLPKRIQRHIEKEERSQGRTRRMKVPKGARTKGIKRLSKTTFIMKRNQVYRSNMITAIKKTFPDVVGKELINALNSMSELEFLKFFLSRPHETIGYIYYDKDNFSSKQLDLMRDIVNAKET